MEQLRASHPDCEVAARPSPFAPCGWGVLVGPCKVEMTWKVMEMISALQALNPDTEVQAVFSARSLGSCIQFQQEQDEEEEQHEEEKEQQGGELEERRCAFYAKDAFQEINVESLFTLQSRGF